MNWTDLQIIDMYYEDGMKEQEIAESLGISLLMVHEVIAAFEESEDEQS
jgi:DNA-binding transcriptional regulator LsrR (DeoR family)